MVNLQRRKGVYYFRLRVPKDLLKWFNRGEIKRSLKTRRLTEAKSLLKIEAAKFEQVALTMRSGMLTDSQIAQLAKQYIVATLATSDEVRLLHGPQPIHAKSSGIVVDTASPYSMFTEEIQGALEGLPSPTLDHVLSHFLDSQGLTLDPASLEYHKLRRELAAAHLEVLRIDEKRDMGNFSDPYYLKAAQEVQEVPQATTAITPAAQPNSEQRLLSTAIEKYLKDTELRAAAGEGSIGEYGSYCNRILWILGDPPISSVTRDDVRRFREVLSQIPPHLNKRKIYRGKSLKEILAMDYEETLSDTTTNEYIRLFKGVFTWAADEGWITDNPAALLKSIPKSSRDDEERAAYDMEDLQRIIDGMAAVEDQLIGNPERFWVPLIGMYTGARVNEVCQLRVSDISNDCGIWHFIIKGKPKKKTKKKSEKTVKTSAANRLIPIHEKLIELGFLDFVEARRKTKTDVLWQNLTAGKRGHSKNFSNWWNGQTRREGFNRKYVSKDPLKVFHSIRHTADNAMKQALVDDRVVDELMGHKHGKLSLDRYGKPYVLETRQKALQAINYPINFDPISDIAKRLR